MTYTTIAQIDSRLAEAQEEWDFWMESGSDFPYDQVTIELNNLNAEFAQLNELRREMVLTEGLQRAVDNFCGAVNNAAEETQEITAIEEQTIEVVALPASDDWLDEELDAMIADPAGTRFLNENAAETAENSQETLEVTHDTFVPYFASYVQFLLWVTGQAVRGVTYIRRILNELSTSTSSVEYAA